MAQYIGEQNFIQLSKNNKYSEKSKQRSKDLVVYIHNTNPYHMSDIHRKRILDCWNYKLFRYYKQTKNLKLKLANFCNSQKYCLICAVKRSILLVDKFINKLKSNPNLYNKHWYYSVLTIEHNSCQAAEEVLEHLLSSIQKLRQKINNARKWQTSSIFSLFDWFVYSIETTKTKNGWNFHVNLLWCSESDIPTTYVGKNGYGNKVFFNKEISEEWCKITGWSYITSTTPVVFGDSATDRRSLMEVMKYNLKSYSMSIDDQYEYIKATKGKRLYGSRWCLYGIKIDLEEEIEDEDTDWVDLLYKYYPQQGYLLDKIIPNA